MLDQETASIMRFILNAAENENPNAYYDDIPEGFDIPAVYFPIPSVITGGCTTSTYLKCFTFSVTVFCKTNTEAMTLADKIATAFIVKRRKVPLINAMGEDSGHFMTIEDVSTAPVDDSVAKVLIRWNSERSYERDNVKKAETFTFEQIIKGG